MRPQLVWRCAAALLLVIGFVELMRFAAALAPSAGAYAAVAHGALALASTLSGVGLWVRARWAAAAIVALGIVLATTQLIEALLLGIRPWLFGLLTAVLALVAAFLTAAWVRAEAR